jgi:hypothetical protein
VSAFSCAWLVAMTDKAGGNVRVGCGRYDWRFEAGTGLAEQLAISVEMMQILPPAALEPVMRWAASLPYPWCATATAVSRAGGVVGVAPVLDWLRVAESREAQLIQGVTSIDAA